MTDVEWFYANKCVRRAGQECHVVTPGSKPPSAGAPMKDSSYCSTDERATLFGFPMFIHRTQTATAKLSYTAGPIWI